MSTNNNEPKQKTDKATQRAAVSPVAILIMSVVLAVFVFLVVLCGTRVLGLSVICGGATFVVCVVIFATLALSVKPDGRERAEILREQHERDYPEGKAETIDYGKKK